MAEPVDVSFDAGGSGSEVLVKIQGGDHWELNLRSTFVELTRLRGIRDAQWNERTSIAVGSSAGAQVFWCAKGETATIMVGHDDETWDIALEVPIAVVQKIAVQAEEQRFG